MTSKRTQRALDKADRFMRRLGDLRRDLADGALDDAARERALVELESLVLIARGSSEEDHRKQLALSGLQAAFERYLAPDASDAGAFAASEAKDELLADEALRGLRAEYPDDAARMAVAEVAAAVRRWAETFGSR